MNADQIPIEFVRKYDPAIVEAWERYPAEVEALTNRIACWWLAVPNVGYARTTAEAIAKGLISDGYRKPDHSGDANKMVDAKCGDCKAEYFWSASKPSTGCNLHGIHGCRVCPSCGECNLEEYARERYSAAHPPAETTTAGNPATVSVEPAGEPGLPKFSQPKRMHAESNSSKISNSSDGLAAELSGVIGEPPGNPAIAAICAHVLRMVNAARIEELKWAIKVWHFEAVQRRIAELKGKG